MILFVEYNTEECCIKQKTRFPQITDSFLISDTTSLSDENNNKITSNAFSLKSYAPLLSISMQSLEHFDKQISFKTSVNTRYKTLPNHRIKLQINRKNCTVNIKSL